MKKNVAYAGLLMTTMIGHLKTRANIQCIYLIAEKDISDFTIIGHSLDGIDMPYFTLMDSYTGKKLMWTVYCYEMGEASAKKQSLIDAGVYSDRDVTIGSNDFYDLKDDESARRRAFELKYGF